MEPSRLPDVFNGHIKTLASIFVCKYVNHNTVLCCIVWGNCGSKARSVETVKEWNKLENVPLNKCSENVMYCGIVRSKKVRVNMKHNCFSLPRFWLPHIPSRLIIMLRKVGTLRVNCKWRSRKINKGLMVSGPDVIEKRYLHYATRHFFRRTSALASKNKGLEFYIHRTVLGAW